MSDGEPRRLVFTKEDIGDIARTLQALLKSTQARFLLLVDKDGHLLTREGEASSTEMDTLSGQVAGSFAAVRQMAKLVGERGYSMRFDYGERDSVQLSMVGERTILAVVFEGRTAQGMIQLYSHQVAAKLTELFDQIADRGRKDSDPFGGAAPPLAPA
jgi:predicted regulator of Ras-like GTPase activity (Roadblock/LC7/MglB family)